MLQSSILLNAEDKAKVKHSELIVMFFLLAISGNPMFTNKYVYPFALVIMAVILLLQRRMRFNLYVILVVLAFAALFALQFVTLQYVSVLADANFLIRLVLAYFCVVYFGVRYRPAYLKVMTFLCLVSLVGYAVFMVFGRWPISVTVGRMQSLVIYNYQLGSVRNAGMFWEPGAFSGYINLLFLLYINEIGYLWKRHRVGFVILLIALITTQSTTGYVVLAYILGMYFVCQSKKKYAKLLLLPILVGVSLYAYTSLDYLGEKVEKDLEEMEAIESGEADVSWSRTATMVIDFNNLKRHPWVGNGFDMDQKYEGLGNAMSGAGNGLTSMLNTLGIPMMLFMLFLMGYRQRTLSIFMRFVFVFGLCLMAFSENYFMQTMFVTLIFYGDYVKRTHTVDRPMKTILVAPEPNLQQSPN